MSACFGRQPAEIPVRDQVLAGVRPMVCTVSGLWKRARRHLGHHPGGWPHDRPPGALRRGQRNPGPARTRPAEGRGVRIPLATRRTGPLARDGRYSLPGPARLDHPRPQRQVKRRLRARDSWHDPLPDSDTTERHPDLIVGRDTLRRQRTGPRVGSCPRARSPGGALRLPRRRLPPPHRVLLWSISGHRTGSVCNRGPYGSRSCARDGSR